MTRREKYKPLVPSDFDMLATVLGIVSRETDWPAEIILKSTASRAAALPRRKAWLELRKRGWTFTKIAKAFNIDHTSVVYGLNQLGVAIPPIPLKHSQAKANLARREAARAKKLNAPPPPPLPTPDDKWAELMAGHTLPVNVNAPVKYRFQEEMEARFI